MDRQTKKQTNAGCHVTSLAEVNVENVISDVHQKGRQCRENTPGVLNYLFVCGCSGGRMCAHLVQHGSGVSCRQTEASSGLWNWCGWKADHYNTNFPFKHFSCKRSDQWDKKNKNKTQTYHIYALTRVASLWQSYIFKKRLISIKCQNTLHYLPNYFYISSSLLFPSSAMLSPHILALVFIQCSQKGKCSWHMQGVSLYCLYKVYLLLMKL